MNKEKHKRKSNIEEERQMLELDFEDMLEKLKEDYLDVYNGIQSEILSTTRFDENSDLSTTYLGRVDTTRTSNIKAEETFPISEQGYTVGKLLDGQKVKYYWTQELGNHLCIKHTICTVSHFICYQNLYLKIKNSSRKWTIC